MTELARQASSLTHADLVHRAYRWLLGAGKCVVAVKERGAFDNGTPSTIGNEIVDAIGWDWYGKSTVIEVKTTHGDFLADARKPHRQGDGMGRRRYFMCPSGVIVPDEIPEGWGLLYATAYQVRVIRSPDDRVISEGRERKEKALLVELLRRVYTRGFEEVVVTPINDYMPFYLPGESPHRRMKARLNLFYEACDGRKAAT